MLFSHSSESIAIAIVCASAASELRYTRVRRLLARQGKGLVPLSSSELVTKIIQPPCDDPSGLVAQLASQYIPKRTS